MKSDILKSMRTTTLSHYFFYSAMNKHFTKHLPTLLIYLPLVALYFLGALILPLLSATTPALPQITVLILCIQCALSIIAFGLIFFEKKEGYLVASMLWGSLAMCLLLQGTGSENIYPYLFDTMLGGNIGAALFFFFLIWDFQSLSKKK